MEAHPTASILHILLEGFSLFAAWRSIQADDDGVVLQLFIGIIGKRSGDIHEPTLAISEFVEELDGLLVELDMRLLCMRFVVNEGTETWSAGIVGRVSFLLLNGFIVFQSPSDCVLEESDESRILEERLAVPKLEIDVASLFLGICPDDGVVTHLDVCLDGVAVLVGICQNMGVLAWTDVVCVPFVFLDDKGVGHTFRDWVLLVFKPNCRITLVGYVVLVAYLAQEV